MEQQVVESLTDSGSARLLPSPASLRQRWLLANIIAGAVVSALSAALAMYLLIAMFLVIGFLFIPPLVFLLWTLLGFCQWLGLQSALPNADSQQGKRWAVRTGFAGLGSTFAAIMTVIVVGANEQSAYDPIVNARAQGLVHVLILAALGAVMGLFIGLLQRPVLETCVGRVRGWLRANVLAWSLGLGLAGIIFGQGSISTLLVLAGYGFALQAGSDSNITTLAGGFTLGVVGLITGLRLPNILNQRLPASLDITLKPSP